MPRRGKASRLSGSEYRQLRQEAALSQAELAKRVGVTISAISQRELGKVIITIEQEYALRYALTLKPQLTPEELHESRSAAGRYGGKRRLQTMTREERREIGRLGARARWSKK